jgi:hypothetical protein
MSLAGGRLRCFERLGGGRGGGGFVGGARYDRRSKKGLGQSVVLNRNLETEI